MNITFSMLKIPNYNYQICNNKISFKSIEPIPDLWEEEGAMADACFKRLVPDKINATGDDIYNWEKGRQIFIETSDKIDLDKLGNIKNKIKVRKENILTGPVLTSLEDGLNKISAAGVKTIVALPGAHSENYQKEAQKKGFKYINLFGKTGLILDNPIFDKNIKGAYQFDNINSFVKDMKSLFSIVNGKNADFPLPMYMGCERGVTRTGFISCLNYVFNTGETVKNIPYTILNSKSAELFKIFLNKLDANNLKELDITDLSVIRNRIFKLIAKI